MTVLSLVSTPSRASEYDRSCEASLSSWGRNFGSSCTRVTCVPSREKVCAASQPSGPPPMMTRRLGREASSKTDSLVR